MNYLSPWPILLGNVIFYPQGCFVDSSSYGASDIILHMYLQIKLNLLIDIYLEFSLNFGFQLRR